MRMYVHKMLAAFLALPLAGCITTYSVKKIDPSTDAGGIRYSLPKPYLMVTPKGDGTIDVEVKYFPDLANTYAITAKSYFAKHKLSVSLQDGLLTAVTFDTDSTGVASQLIESGASVKAERLKAEAEAAKAEAAKEAEAQAAVVAAEKALRAAQAELQALLANNAPENEIRAARVKVAVAEANLAAAQEAAGRLSGGSAESNNPGNTDSANAPPAAADVTAAGNSKNNSVNTGTESTPPAAADVPAAPVQAADPFPLKSRGPIFFEIVDKMENGTNVVKLVAQRFDNADFQGKFSTVVPPPVPPEPPPPPTLFPKHVATVTPKDGLLALKIQADRPISQLLLGPDSSSSLVRVDPPPVSQVSLPRTIALLSPTEIQVVFDPGTPNGLYQLTLEFKYPVPGPEKEKGGSDLVSLEIRR